LTAHLPRIVSFVLAALLAAIIGFWASSLMAPQVAVAPVSVTAESTATSDATWARQFFGMPKDNAAIAGPAVDAQFQVLGLISGRNGVAVISTDGKPGRPIAVGQTIVQGSVLKAVLAEKVIISRNGKNIELGLPTKQTMAILTSGASKGGPGTAILTGGTVGAPSPAPPPVFTPPNMPPTPGTVAPNMTQPPTSPIPNPVGVTQQPTNNSGTDVQTPIGGAARGAPPS
jgi:hypothetical protein